MDSNPYVRIDGGHDLRGVLWEVGTLDGGLCVTIEGGAFQLNLHGSERDKFTRAVDRAMMPGQRVKHGPGCRCTPCKAAYPLAQPPPGDPAVSAYLARRATCRHCGEPGLVPSPAVLGMWLSDRQGTGRGLCPDGETMHRAGNITEGNGSGD